MTAQSFQECAVFLSIKNGTCNYKCRFGIGSV